jgi:hypothetical protein
MIEYKFEFNGMLLESDPFSVAPVEEGHEHYNMCLYEVWNMPLATAEQIRDDHLWTDIRAQRNKLIAESDWTQNRDVVLSNDEEWAAYRQSLRDITTQSDPSNIIWPTPPS